eukprot:TRINITY_DN1068_c0_g2_i2.p2 TRINITY_DN1068_c0_g2~~TRINITY_DN1068_c0_g2_i2.p2  ORF type:complete len:110 (+),score=35.90 TRINITY_DN1068_c0_g2_i2:41-331(+)
MPSFIPGGLCMLFSILIPSFWHDIKEKGRFHPATIFGLSVIEENVMFMFELIKKLQGDNTLQHFWLHEFCCCSWIRTGCGCRPAKGAAKIARSTIH